MVSHPVSHPGSEELRKEARQLKKELQAIKQRKDEGSKPTVGNDQEGNRKENSAAVCRDTFLKIVATLM